ncbi:MAG: CRTAC1 family protein [Candidatus Cloacimonetes bacterium]|nr:CRTAC1 family protein [Candidatus Cloacimonadota bacterium]MBS3767006.1 CRTAC1 family protein [Candidatus Cloacimonadota bacterium]
MKKIILISFLIILSCSSQKVTKYPQNHKLAPQQQKMREINKLALLEEYQQAIEKCRSYIKKYPHELDGYKILLHLLDSKGTPKEEINRIKENYLASLESNVISDSLVLQINYLFSTKLDSVSAENIKQKLITNYPRTELASSITQEKIYALITERNDSLRAVELQKFLQKYNKTKWAPLAWKYLLYSYDESDQNDKLDSTLTYLEKNKFDTPQIKNLVSFYYARQGESLQKYETIIKNVIASVDSASQPKYFDFLQEKSKNEILQQYYFTYVKILFKQENYENILNVLQRFAKSKMHSDLLFYKGKALYEIERAEEAFTAFLECTKKGDKRTYWSSKADSNLKQLHHQLTGSKENFLPFARLWDEYKGAEFADVTNSAGLDSINAGRVAWGDYDNDGYDDLLLDGKRLFRNKQDGTFNEVTEEVGISNTRSVGGLWADIDRDGWLDFYAASGSSEKADKLWKNEQGKRFVDITAQTPISDTLKTEGAAWGDIEGDLYPDLYVANYELWRKIDSEPDYLFKNLGNGKFRDVTTEMNIIPPLNQNQAGRGVAWGDYNNDGFLDIYVSNYRLDKNFLWENQNGKFFYNVAQNKEVEGNYVEGWFGHTIGSDWGDFDNDGDLDLITANLAHPRYINFSDKTMLYENMDEGDTFINIRKEAGITYDECHSDPTWFDANGDGYLDLYITSIYPNRRSYLYQNNGNKTFTDITYLSCTRTTNSWGAAVSDYDNDGDEDLLVCSREGIHLFKNDTEIKNWLKVKVVDKNKKTPVIGSRIYTIQNDFKQMREVKGGKGTTNQNSLTQYFAFPSSEIVKLRVRFPDGKKVEKVIEKLGQTVIIAYPITESKK